MSNPPATPSRMKAWAWPMIVLGVGVVFAARVYFQHTPLVLDGRQPKSELLAEVSTPAGARTLERMLKQMADPQKSLGTRTMERVRGYLPNRLTTQSNASPDENLMNMLLVLEKLPPEYKIRYVPIFIEMLDHPDNGTLAIEQLEKLGRANTNVITMMVNNIEEHRAVQRSLNVPLLHVILSVAPAHPGVFDLLANSVTNQGAAVHVRIRSMDILFQRFASHPKTSQLLTVAATDPDPMVSASAASVLGLLRPQIRVGHQ